MIYRTAIALLALVMISGCVSKRAITHEYSSPSLTATEYTGSEPVDRDMVLAVLNIDIHLSPGFAHTTLSATFANPVYEELEGKFTVQLPDQAVVTGYALDIEEIMLEGVIGASPVVKRVYKEKVRGNIDPGIGEITKRNEFVTEVYPIPSGGQRTIRVSFIAPHAKGHAFELPLTTLARRFALTVHSRSEPRIELPATSTLDIADDDSRMATANGNNVHLDGVLRITTRSPLEPLWARDADNSLFVFLPFAATPRADAPLVQSMRIYWDKSLSAAEHADTAHAFLSALLAARNIKFELKTFDYRGAQPASIDDISTLSYGGATSFVELFRSESTRPAVDVCILVSDGHISIGPLPSQELPCRLHTVTAARGANRLLLNELALRHDGVAIDLGRVSLKDAVNRALASQVESPQLAVDNKSHLPALWSAGDNRAYVVALPDSATSIRLANEEFARPEKIADTTAKTLAPWWAFQRIQALAAQGVPISQRLALARQHSVLGEDMTFVVFEDLEDYIAADLPFPSLPPDIDPDWIADYEAYKAELQEEWATERTFDENALRAQWRDLIAWYQTDFVGPAEVLADKHRSSVATPQSPGQHDATGHHDRVRQTTVVSAERRSEPGGTVEEVIVTASMRESEIPPIAIEPWSPDTEYFKAAEHQCGTTLADSYREHMSDHGLLPIYHLHMGDIATRCGDHDLAAVVYTSALELDSTDPETYMAVGYRLLDLHDYDNAIDLFTKVAQLDEARPQPLFALARALVRSAQHTSDHAAKAARYQRALEILHRIVFSYWDEAYYGMPLIALVEANGAIQTLQSIGVDEQPFASDWVFSMPVDLRMASLDLACAERRLELSSIYWSCCAASFR